jgi:UMF1 family MFS transporter
MSFESDDEELDRELGTGTKQTRYEGEDVSPTSTRELNGWYAYPVAAEVFAVVAVGTYISLYIQVLSLALLVDFGNLF